jgi:hypothetical protein
MPTEASLSIAKDVCSAAADLSAVVVFDVLEAAVPF